MSNILCVHHHPCVDGYASAWVMNRTFPHEVQFHPGKYQDQPPDVTGRDVVMVDFSYKRAVIEEMRKTARSILIIDHHKTAAEDLGDYPEIKTGVGAWRRWMEFVGIASRDPSKPTGIISVCFDMTRSGAGLTWDFFCEGKQRPALINLIEDRDLWRNDGKGTIKGTREVAAAVFSYPYDFKIWDEMMTCDPARLIEEGIAIERKHNKDVKELVKQSVRMMTIGGVYMPVANLPYTMASDACHMMALGSKYGAAASYIDMTSERIFSLRSTPEGIDVSDIAKIYGGGGHAHAAGFKRPIGWEGDTVRGHTEQEASVRGDK